MDIISLLKHPEADHDWLMLASDANHIPEADKYMAASHYGPWLLRFPQLWDTPEIAHKAIETMRKVAPQDLTSFVELLAQAHPEMRIHNISSWMLGDALPDQTVSKWFGHESPLLKGVALAGSSPKLLQLLAQEDWHKHDEALYLWEALKRNQHLSPEILDLLISKLNPKNSQDFVLATKVLDHPLFKPKEDLSKVLDKAAAVFAANYNNMGERAKARIEPWLKAQPKAVKLQLHLNPLIIPNLDPQSKTLKKSEPFGYNLSGNVPVSPVNPLDDELATQISQAFNSGKVEAIKLDGKYSKGSRLAAINGKVYLLKGEPIEQNDIKGSDEQKATPAQREAAFPKLAQAALKGDPLAQAFLPAALVQAGDHIYAVMEWKGGKGTCTLDELYRHDPVSTRKLLDEKLQNGDLHKLAAIDYLFGNGDRHGNNVMTDGKEIYMIDHAGAFAGRDFSPATDGASFVPFYLRTNVEPLVNFNELSGPQKFNHMSVANINANRDIRAWLHQLPIEKMVEMAKGNGIDVSGIWKRYQELLRAVNMENASQGINRLWTLGK